MRSPYDILLRDPLSETTRRERKFLLATSAIALTVLHAGLVPTKIEALGIQFSQVDQKVLLRAMAAVIAYFVCGFLVYGVSDFVAWRRDFHLSRREALLEQMRKYKEYESLSGERSEDESTKPFKKLTYFEKWQYESQLLMRAEFPTSFVRACFDFLLPIAVGILATVQLFLA